MNLKLVAPVVLEAKIYFTSEYRMPGIIKYSLPAGEVPTVERMREIINEAIAEASAQSGIEFKSMSKRDFVSDVIQERTGQERYVATSEDWENE